MGSRHAPVAQTRHTPIPIPPRGMPHEPIWGIPRLVLTDLEYALMQPRMGSRYASIVEGGSQSSQKRHTSILGCGIPRIGLKLTWSIPRLLRSSGTRYTPKYPLRYTSLCKAAPVPQCDQVYLKSGWGILQFLRLLGKPGYTSFPPATVPQTSVRFSRFLFVGMGYTSRGRDLYWSIPLDPFL